MKTGFFNLYYMYDLERYPEIIDYLKSISRIFKNKQEWIEIFCPYCNDATRKTNPTHGHFNISKKFNFCRCWRCENTSAFTSFLKDVNFGNPELIKILQGSSLTNYTYTRNRTRYLVKQNIKKEIENIYCSFDNKLLRRFLYYINSRCLNINPISFLLAPRIINNKLACVFYNYLGLEITARFIDLSNERYHTFGSSDYYFFQNINNILEYENVVICEGGFDLINLYKYSPYFSNENTFYIAINGREYHKIFKELVQNYFLIGPYNFNFVLDKNIFNIKKIQYLNNLFKTQMNPEINITYYEPTLTKDVSEIMHLSILQ